MICTSDSSVLIAAKSYQSRNVLWIRAWSPDYQLRLDDGGENL